MLNIMGQYGKKEEGKPYRTQWRVEFCLSLYRFLLIFLYMLFFWSFVLFIPYFLFNNRFWMGSTVSFILVKKVFGPFVGHPPASPPALTRAKNKTRTTRVLIQVESKKKSILLN